MKRKIYFIILALFLFIIFGCSNQDMPNKPDDIRSDIWNGVNKHYRIIATDIGKLGLVEEKHTKELQSFFNNYDEEELTTTEYLLKKQFLMMIKYNLELNIAIHEDNVSAQDKARKNYFMQKELLENTLKIK